MTDDKIALRALLEKGSPDRPGEAMPAFRLTMEPFRPPAVTLVEPGIFG